MARIASPQTLLLDADDTLWENNIYFEQAIAAFIGFLDHKDHSPAAVRETLNDCERETIRSHGYGLPSFTRSLLRCFERLSPEPLTEARAEKIRSLAQSIAQAEVRLFAGVAETLATLATRHRLILMTKGNHAEQADKFSRSGLAPYFSAVEIVAEKDPEAYLRVIQLHGLPPRSGWMIGNSPKSDINPALAAGLNAVFLFHPDTWVLEHAELATPPEGQQLLELEKFTQLAEVF